MNESLDYGWWLLYATMLLSIWNAGIVWFTHIAVYPLWPVVGGDQFSEYHRKWWRDMRPAFGPVVLMFLCSIALLWIRSVGIPWGLLLIGVLLQVAVHCLTIFYWAPVQAAMETPSGMSLPKYAQLMRTHWIRVAFFAAYAVLMVWQTAALRWAR